MKTFSTNPANRLIMLVMVIAMAFAFSCSGDDGADGANGEPGAPGTDGVNGSKGDKGDPGTPGAPCTLLENVITCGANSFEIPTTGIPGTPGASCVPETDDNGSVSLKCGTEPAIMISCGGSPFNSKTQICDDRDGNAYKFVKIGEQVWLAENLKFKTTGSKCYADLSSNCAKYGRLYNWTEAKVACPSGWSLPDTTQFAALIASAGGAAAAVSNLKSEEEVGGKNSIGFGALLGGSCQPSGCQNEGIGGSFWSNTKQGGEGDLTTAYIMRIQNLADIAPRMADYSNSVRCIKD